MCRSVIWGWELIHHVNNESSHLLSPSYVLGTILHVQHFDVVWSLSRVRLFCDPMDCSPPGCSVHGISQARILEWVAFSGNLGSRRPSCLPSCDGSCLHHLPSHHTLRCSPGKLHLKPRHPQICRAPKAAGQPPCLPLCRVITLFDPKPRSSIKVHSSQCSHNPE